MKGLLTKRKPGLRKTARGRGVCSFHSLAPEGAVESAALRLWPWAGYRGLLERAGGMDAYPPPQGSPFWPDSVGSPHVSSLPGKVGQQIPNNQGDSNYILNPVSSLSQKILDRILCICQALDPDTCRPHPAWPFLGQEVQFNLPESSSSHLNVVIVQVFNPNIVLGIKRLISEHQSAYC